VFASLYGSVMLMRPEERRMVKGLLVNKFRGDIRLFDDGRRILERICGIPVLGVIPYFHHIHVEEEDSVPLERKSSTPESGMPNVAVVRLPHLSNYTDFNVLESHPSLHVYFTARPADLVAADVVVVPGSKAVLSDLQWMRQAGVADAVVAAHRQGKVVLGICGGYQMMGRMIGDPYHVEGTRECGEGLGLLPVSTELAETKRTRQSRGKDGEGNVVVGFEIHQGVTHRHGGKRLFLLDDGTEDGCRVDDRCMGTYLHGILENPSFLRRLFAPLNVRIEDFDYATYREHQLDLLAAHVRENVDMSLLYKILTTDD